MKKVNGFSLIEVLVAVSIVAVLFGLAITNYSAAQKSGRDTTRQTDLSNLQGVLERYKADKNYYPTALPSPGTALTDGGSRTYLTVTPADPLSDAAYDYQKYPADCDNSTTICTNYCLSTTFENKVVSPQPDYTACDTPANTKVYQVTAP